MRRGGGQEAFHGLFDDGGPDRGALVGIGAGFAGRVEPAFSCASEERVHLRFHGRRFRELVSSLCGEVANGVRVRRAVIS